MIALCIDTSLEDCLVAICENGALLAHECVQSRSKQAEILPQMVVDLCQSVKIAPKDINRIGVTIGPGSFTGVRVGLAFAKGLAIATGAQIVGISTLECFGRSAPFTKAIAIIEQMGSIFAASFENGKIINPPKRFENFEFLSEFAVDWGVIGQSAPENIGGREFFSQSSIDVIEFAKLIDESNPISNPPIPQYLRGADAKLWQGSQYV